MRSEGESVEARRDASEASAWLIDLIALTRMLPYAAPHHTFQLHRVP